MSLAPQTIVAISKFDGVGEKNVVAGAQVIITRRAGGAQNIYSDEAGTALITQPAYTDENGELKFFIADGAYTYTIAGQSYSVDVNSSQTATFSTVTASQLIGFHYGNGYNLTNLRADMIDNGILNELRLPSVINSSKTFQNGDFLVKPASGNTQLSLTTAGSYINAPSGAPAFGATDSLTSVSFGGNTVLQASSTFSKIRFNSLDIVTAETSATKVKFNSADILVASAGQTVLFREGSTTPAILAGASTVQLFSPAAPVISATSTTTTINAGNGANAIAISSTGGVVAQDYLGQKYSREHQWNWTHDGTLYAAVDIIIDSSFGWGEIEINVSGDYLNANNSGAIHKSQQVAFSGEVDYRTDSIVREYSASGAIASRYHIGDLYFSASRSAWVVTVTTLYSSLSNPVIIRAKLTLQARQSNQAVRGLTLSDTYTGTSKTAYATGLTVPSLQADSATISGSSTAGNFYGNGFNLTQLNASEVKNGLLPSNIFPATISAATVTFDNTIRAKGGTAYNLLDITSAASILRDSAGNDVFNASTTALALKRANNILINATSTATQLFNHAGSIRANFDASVSQIFSPANVPFVSATTTTATITSGNGATCLTIDSTGAGLMKFPVYTVSTVPSASANADRVIIVSNASLGRGLYTSDGTNWRSAQSGTILS